MGEADGTELELGSELSLLDDALSALVNGGCWFLIKGFYLFWKLKSRFMRRSC